MDLNFDSFFMLKTTTHINQKLCNEYECNTHTFILFNLEKQSIDFSYTKFPIKKIIVGKILNYEKIVD
jgi:hypothetical protein